MESSEVKMSKQQMSKGTSTSHMTGMSEKPRPRVRKCDGKNSKPKAKWEKGKKPEETKKQTTIRSGLKKLVAQQKEICDYECEAKTY